MTKMFAGTKGLCSSSLRGLTGKIVSNKSKLTTDEPPPPPPPFLATPSPKLPYSSLSLSLSHGVSRRQPNPLRI